MVEGRNNVLISEAVKSRILELCSENNLSVNGLAIKCGLRQSTINNILNGNSKNPTINSIEKICQGLDISLAQFFEHPLFQMEQEEKGV